MFFGFLFSCIVACFAQNFCNMQYGFEIFGGMDRSDVCDCFMIVGRKKLQGFVWGAPFRGFFGASRWGRVRSCGGVFFDFCGDKGTGDFSIFSCADSGGRHGA